MPFRRIAIGLDTTLLAANASIDTLEKNCLDFKTIRGMIYSNVASALNGISIEQSVDKGNNWDLKDTDTLVAGTAFKFEYTLYGSHVRVTFKNGGTIQTAFRASIQMVE